MSGPVWRFEGSEAGICDVCFRVATGMFVEGAVIDNELHPTRRICPPCLQAGGSLVINGEVGTRRPGPAYARH